MANPILFNSRRPRQHRSRKYDQLAATIRAFIGVNLEIISDDHPPLIYTLSLIPITWLLLGCWTIKSAGPGLVSHVSRFTLHVSRLPLDTWYMTLKLLDIGLRAWLFGLTGVNL